MHLGSTLPTQIETAGHDRIRIDALTRTADVAEDPGVAVAWPALAEAIHASVSPQVRSIASIGGDLVKSPRWDLHVALLALDAMVRLRGPTGERAVSIAELHAGAGAALAPGEIVTAIELAATPVARRSRYIKVRDRSAFAFVVAAAAVGLEIEDGTIRAARVAIGGLGAQPWRSPAAEAELVGELPSTGTYQRAAKIALADIPPLEDDRFQRELVERTITRALAVVGGVG